MKHCLYIVMLRPIRCVFRDQQVVSCSKWREAKLDMVEREWQTQAVPFAGGQYNARIFPTSWRRHRTVYKPNHQLLF